LRVHPDICGLRGLHRAHLAVSTTSWVPVRVWGLGRCRSGSSPSHLALVSEPPSRPAAGVEVDPDGPSSRPATPRLRFFTPPPTSLPPSTPGNACALPSGRPDQGRLPFRPRGFAPPRRLAPATGSRFVAPWCRPWGSPRSPVDRSACASSPPAPRGASPFEGLLLVGSCAASRRSLLRFLAFRAALGVNRVPCARRSAFARGDALASDRLRLRLGTSLQPTSVFPRGRLKPHRASPHGV
jgi:hypothetical protein